MLMSLGSALWVLGSHGRWPSSARGGQTAEALAGLPDSVWC